MSSIYRELSSDNKYLFNKCVDYYCSLKFVEDAIRDKSDSETTKILRNLIKEKKTNYSSCRMALYAR